MQTLTYNRSVDQLEENLLTLSQRRNELEYEFLKAVQEFEIRQGWRLWHMNSCAEWLNLKCGMATGTAREKVRVAMALFNLPKCSEAFAQGKLSYSNARSITRIATPENEEELVDYAVSATADQVQTWCRRVRNGQEASTQDARQAHRARWLSCSDDGDGRMQLTATLPKEAGDLVMKAVELAAARLAGDESDEADADGFFARQADALVEMARGYLSGGADKSSSTADHYQVLLHVDETVLKREGGESDLPVESARRVTCDASLVEVTRDSAGNPLELGRKKRVVSPQLKRALLARDKHCRYPGCTHTHWLDAHHVMHWAEGGETSLDNCILLCSKHHRLLHEGGFTIEKNYKGERYFMSNHGKCIVEPLREPMSATDADEDASRDGFMHHIAEMPGFYAVRAIPHHVLFM